MIETSRRNQNMWFSLLDYRKTRIEFNFEVLTPPNAFKPFKRTPWFCHFLLNCACTHQDWPGSWIEGCSRSYEAGGFTMQQILVQGAIVQNLGQELYQMASRHRKSSHFQPFSRHWVNNRIIPETPRRNQNMRFSLFDRLSKNQNRVQF